MARLLKQPTRVFAFFMIVGTALQASFAQDARSKDRTVASCTSLEKIFPLPLTEVGPPTKGDYSLPVRRFGASIPAQVLADCGNAAFTAVFDFNAETSDPPATFAVQPRTLLTEPPLWYVVYEHARVYVSIQLPEAPGDKAQSPKLLIDVLCDGCSTDGAVVYYEPAVPVESMERARLYHLVPNTHRSLIKQRFPIALVPPGTETSGEETTHTVAFEKQALCSNPHGAAVSLRYTSAPQKEAFHWVSESSRSPKLYEAKVGASLLDEERKIYFRADNEAVVFCTTDSNEKIVLQIRCQKGCSFDRDVAWVELFDDATLHHNADTAKFRHVEGFWDNIASICYVNFKENSSEHGVGEELRDYGILTIRYELTNGCDRRQSSFWQRQAQAFALETQLANRLDSVTSAFRVEECLCRGLKGYVNLRIDWDPIEESKTKTDVTGGSKRDKEPRDYSSLSKSAECFHSKDEKEWILVADISAPEIRCATNTVTAVFHVRSDNEVTHARFGVPSSGRYLGPFASPGAQVFEVTLRPGTTASSMKTCEALPISEVVPLILKCPDCSKMTADVQFTSMPALGSIRADRPKWMPFKSATTGRLRAYRLSAVVDDGVLARGPGAKFTAILQMDATRRPGEPRYFAARPRTLLAYKDAWYVVAYDESSFKLYMSLQLPDKREDKSHSLEIVVDIECDPCNLNSVKLLYAPQDSEMLFRSARQYNDVQYCVERPNPEDFFPLVLETPGTPREQRKIWTAEFDKTSLCASPFGATVQVVSPWIYEATFYWEPHSSSSSSSRIGKPPKSYPAVVGKVSYSDCYYIVFRTNKEEMDFCGQTTNTKLTLRIDCPKGCSFKDDVVRLCLPQSPQVLQQGVSLEPIANLATAFRKQGASPACNLIVPDNKGSEVLQLTSRRSAFFRLWHTDPMSCKEPVDTALRALEAQLALGTATVGQPIVTTQCICEGLRGGVYRLLDWGPVEREKDHSGMEDKGGHDERGTASKKSENPQTLTDMRNTNEATTSDMRNTNEATTSDMRNTKGATTKDISSGSMTMGSNEVRRTHEAVSPEFQLLPNTASSGKTQKGRVVFENWISAERLHSMVPFVTMFCFKSSTGSIESVSLAETVPLQSFKSPGKNLQCYAFNSCDAWRAAPASPPQIVVVGKSVPKSVHWRLDEAIPFASLSPEGSHASRGGWYGTAEQRKRFNAVKGVVEAKVIKTASSFQCIFSDLSNKKGSQGAGDATEAAPSSTAETFVFLVPSYQLTLTEGLLLSSSGDMCSFGISVFVGVFVILAFYE